MIGLIIYAIIVFFGLFMMYTTYIFHKKGVYDNKRSIFWSLIWLVFILLTISSDYILSLSTFQQEGIIYLLGIFMLLLSATSMFYLYKKTKQNENLVRSLVQQLAYDEFDKSQE